jgi:hypothetical protein
MELTSISRRTMKPEAQTIDTMMSVTARMESCTEPPVSFLSVFLSLMKVTRMRQLKRIAV